MNMGGAATSRRLGRDAGVLIRTVTGSSLVRLLLALGIAAGVVVLGLTHWSTLNAGSDSLAGADKRWLVLAGVAAVAIWVAGTVTQLGSMALRPPLGRLLAVQVAASFANHLLPAGSGGMGINIRFLRRHGLGSGAAASSVGLNSLAGLATHIVLLVAAVAISPSVARSVRVPVSWRGVAASIGPPIEWGLLVLGSLVLLTLLVAALRATWRERLTGAVRRAGARVLQELRDLGAVLRHPARAAALWLGSLSTPLLHAVILFAVLRALGVPVAMGTAVVVYLVVSSLSAVVPSPGGLGALDVTLAAGLAAVGVSSAAALGAVLGYRLITVWLPLLPSGLVLAVLLRRRII